VRSLFIRSSNRSHEFTLTPCLCVYIYKWHCNPGLGPNPTNRKPSISARRFSRGTADDASADEQVANRLNVDQDRALLEYSGSTIIARPSLHESNPGRVRSVTIPMLERSLQEALKYMLLFVHASSVGYASNNFRLFHGLHHNTHHQLLERLAVVIPKAECRPRLSLRRWCYARVAIP